MARNFVEFICVFENLSRIDTTLALGKESEDGEDCLEGEEGWECWEGEIGQKQEKHPEGIGICDSMVLSLWVFICMQAYMSTLGLNPYSMSTISSGR